MWIEYLRIAQKALRGHKFRSLLTVLSITIGAFSIVLMSSLAESGLTTLIKSIEDLGGGRIIMVWGKKPERMESKSVNYTKGITTQDRDLLFSTLPHLEGHTQFSSRDRQDLIGDTGGTWRSDFVAADGNFLDSFKMRLDRGRGFTEDENKAHAKVCVIGAKPAKMMFDGDAVGHWMTVTSSSKSATSTVAAPSTGSDSNTQGVRCHIIGQLADQDRFGIGFGFDWVDVVVAPLETYNDHDPTTLSSAGLVAKTTNSIYNNDDKRIMNVLLTSRHNNVDDFQIIDFSRFMDKFNALFSIMRAIVGFVAGIALLVGGVGVMNMMLVSVSERVREIGIRKALGASPRDIAAQFLCEAVVLSGSGGLVGITAGVLSSVGVSALIRHFKPTWVGVIDHRATIIALSVSVGIGVLFGFFPARRASKLDAILAIRR